MAVEFCTTSPRISFSQYLTQSSDGSSHTSIPLDPHLSDSTSPDFDFCVFGSSCDHESSSADDLFSDGMILPLQFKMPVEAEKPPSPALKDRKEESLTEIQARSVAAEKPDSTEKPAVSRSFWRFRRSSSFNCSNGHKSSSIWSLQLLSRSNSTGSTDQNHKHSNFKETQKTLVQKTPSSNSNSNLKAFPPLPSSSLQKPPLKKNSSVRKTHYGSYGNGVRISPILNVPSPYISKGTTSLFGFEYFFSGRKDKKIKKKPFSPNAP